MKCMQVVIPVLSWGYCTRYLRYDVDTGNRPGHFIHPPPCFFGYIWNSYTFFSVLYSLCNARMRINMQTVFLYTQLKGHSFDGKLEGFWFLRTMPWKIPPFDNKSVICFLEQLKGISTTLQFTNKKFSPLSCMHGFKYTSQVQPINRIYYECSQNGTVRGYSGSYFTMVYHYINALWSWWAWERWGGIPIAHLSMFGTFHKNKHCYPRHLMDPHWPILLKLYLPYTVQAIISKHWFIW